MSCPTDERPTRCRQWSSAWNRIAALPGKTLVDLSIAYSNMSVQVDDALVALSDPLLTREGVDGPVWMIRGGEDPNPTVMPVRPRPARGLRQRSEFDKETLIADFAA